MRFYVVKMRGAVYDFCSFSGSRPSFFAMLTCLHFHALFLDISGPAKKLRKSHLVILVLWCFVFRHLALFRCCSWTAFGPRSRAPLGLVGSGRAALDQGPFLFILGSPLWLPKWSQGNGRNTEKQMLFVVFSGGFGAPFWCAILGLECGGPFPSRK